ncbi:hypothetical protein E2320_009454 [Naja naja]|nr:hypothetical protein E2320_009454 [Naja naja]
MSTLYPSLEDMKVYHMLTVRTAFFSSLRKPPLGAQDNAVGPQPRAPAPAPAAREMPEPPKADAPPVLYPNLADLNDYMGLSLSSEEIQKNLGLVPTGNSGLFVQLVKANSPAALVGLRFGDQILQIDGKNCAGWNMEKAKRTLKKASPEKIVMVVRDRPFQRTVTMHKDSTGHVGFVIKRGQITSLARDSSAAQNGLLTKHYICEVSMDTWEQM